ncbi:MAG TPA: hypothetical protein VM681_02355 [Candidatus Thermoplasmatota archaeon]|nr:hypothetical protein [Candidatus Thermoplasmatota archaeon]
MRTLRIAALAAALVLSTAALAASLPAASNRGIENASERSNRELPSGSQPEETGDSGNEAGPASEPSRGRGLAVALEHVPERVAEKLTAIQQAFADGLTGLGALLRDLFDRARAAAGASASG